MFSEQILLRSYKSQVCLFVSNTPVYCAVYYIFRTDASFANNQANCLPTYASWVLDYVWYVVLVLRMQNDAGEYVDLYIPRKW